MIKKRILVVDDEENLVWAVRQCLSDEGYEVLTAYDGVEALDVARRHSPDLIILDIVMPRLDGLQVCRRLRRDPTLAAIRVLFLTERGAVEDRVRGLEQGGDDYLPKPFDTRELLARVQALLRRSRLGPNGRAGNECHRLSVGTLTLDVRTRQVQVGEEVVQITPTEFDVLHHLMIHEGEVFSSRDLLQQMWGSPPGTENLSTVRWHIKNLREKIEPDPGDPIYIRTVPHQGYTVRGEA